MLANASGNPKKVFLAQLRDRREELEDDLLSLLYATGLAHDGSDASAYWREATNEGPTHMQLQSRYRRMSKASNPLAPTVCRPELHPGFNAMLRHRWAARWRRQGRHAEPSLRILDWNSLLIAEKEEIRRIARHLAWYHGQFIRRGREQKTDLDTALMGLADIFLSFTALPGDRYNLPHSRETFFIQFAVLALEPVALHFEVSDSALSRRWERVKANTRRDIDNNL